MTGKFLIVSLITLIILPLASPSRHHHRIKRQNQNDTNIFRTFQTYPYQMQAAATTILTTFVSDFNFVSELLDHGCWCAKFNPDSNLAVLGGNVLVDELDHICKNWQQARRCTRYPGQICENYGSGDFYEIDFNVSPGYVLDTKICTNGDACLKQTCEIDVWFLHEIEVWKNNNPSFSADRSVSCSAPVVNGQGEQNCDKVPDIRSQYESLISCTTGYYMNDFACNVNICSCSNGMGATGASCTNHGDPVCSSCFEGYFLQGNDCVANQCSCPNGTPATGSDCPISNELICSSCDQGFWMSNGVCGSDQTFNSAGFFASWLADQPT